MSKNIRLHVPPLEGHETVTVTQTEARSAFLPYPPSVNQVFKPFGRRLIKSREGRAYTKAAQAAWVAAVGRLPPLTGPVALELEVVRPRRSGDLSNRIKVLEDALTGFAYVDDSQVVELHAWRFDDKTRPGVLVRVRPR